MITQPVTRSGYARRRDEEQEWRERGSYLVVFFGMLGYSVLAVCDTKEEAEAVLAAWIVCVSIANLAGNTFKMRGWTRDALTHDFDVRTQKDQDDLTEAILGSYR